MFPYPQSPVPVPGAGPPKAEFRVALRLFGSGAGAPVTVAAPTRPGVPVDSRRPVRQLLGAYVALTKPRIIELLLVTTVPAMILAQRGMPSLWLVVATLVGGTFAAGSANTINCYVDRDIDKIMRRTSRRPLARALVRPIEALRFGIVLGAAATLLLGFTVNWPLGMDLAKLKLVPARRS